MKQEERVLLMLRVTMGGFPADVQDSIEKIAKEIRQVVADNAEAGEFALALVGAEFAARGGK